MTLEYIATCLFGMEALLGAEIDSLGYTRIETIDGRVRFSADESAAARANINLRFAERLYLLTGTFNAVTFDELFEGTRVIPWENYISREDAYPVSGHSIKSTLFSVPDCQKIIKKSISTRLGQKYGLTTLPENGITYKIEFFIFKNNVSLMIDLSGTPLHKRGYRPESVTAPLRETLAAGLAKLSRPRENVMLCDPFCGSGTIAIEGAMIMKNIAPGINRSFCAQSFPMFGKKLWSDAYEEARDAVVKNTEFVAQGSDIDENCIRIAHEASVRAGVSDCTSFIVRDALDITHDGKRGTIVSNPPYGERLTSIKEAENLYRKMGSAFSSLESWQIYILTSNDKFPALFGRRADKVRKLYNGMIPCYFFQFFKNNKNRFN